MLPPQPSIHFPNHPFTDRYPQPLTMCVCGPTDASPSKASSDWLLVELGTSCEDLVHLEPELQLAQVLQGGMVPSVVGIAPTGVWLVDGHQAALAVWFG